MAVLWQEHMRGLRRRRDDNDDDDGPDSRPPRRQRSAFVTALDQVRSTTRQMSDNIHHASVSMSLSAASHENEEPTDEMPMLAHDIHVRSPEDIDLSTPPLSEPHIVWDDLEYPGTLLYPTPLPGPHCIVINEVTGQAYRVQRMSFSYLGARSCVWYRDVFRHNITFISGTLCRDTMNDMNGCECGICGSIRYGLQNRRTCMRPASPSGNRDTYVYVHEYFPPSQDTLNLDDDAPASRVEELHRSYSPSTEHAMSTRRRIRRSAIMRRFSRNSEGTFSSAPVVLTDDIPLDDHLGIPNHITRPGMMRLTQSVGSRSARAVRAKA
jgi:hypothetical protein